MIANIAGSIVGILVLSFIVIAMLAVIFWFVMGVWLLFKENMHED